jgi:centromeric protein E
VEIKDLQEKVLHLEQQLSVKVDVSPEQCTEQEVIDLKSKLLSKVLALVLSVLFN